MAGPKRPVAPVAPVLSDDDKRKAINRLENRIRELEDLPVATINSGDDAAIKSLSASIRATLVAIYGAGTPEYNIYRAATTLDLTAYRFSLGFESRGPAVQEVRAGITEGRDRAVALLRQAVTMLREELGPSVEEGGEDHGVARGVSTVSRSNQVFVVHGRDSEAKIEVARLLERAGLDVMILHEQPHAGRTIIEKFEQHASEVGFAVVLLTPDDVGGLSPDALKPRARQNVIGEMFWFAGKFGRSRVCALRKGDVELPSDFAGVGYVEMDGRGAWKMELLKELTAAGYTVDWKSALA